MTKSEKARRAKAAAASRKYRAMKKRAKAKALLTATEATKKTLQRRNRKAQPVSETIKEAAAGIALSDVINTAVNQAADRVAARFGEKDHTDRLANEGGALAPHNGQPDHVGAFSAMMTRLDALLDRAYTIRGRQGNSLVEAVGERESNPPQTVPGNTNAVTATPPLGYRIVEQINSLDRVLADLDAQSCIICNTLA